MLVLGSAGTSSSENPPQQTSQGMQSATAGGALAEHKRIFRGAGAFQPRAQHRQGNKKGKNRVTTCTLKVFCLANVDDDRPPTTIASKTALSNIGLGPGSIVCNVNAPSVHEYLITRYPPLSQAGGYELPLFQRGGEEQGFYTLPRPYSPPRIKEIAGKATVYVRPLQKDIHVHSEMEKHNQDLHVQSQVSSIILLHVYNCDENFLGCKTVI